MELDNQSVIQISNAELTRNFRSLQMLTAESFLMAIAQQITRKQELQSLWLEGVDCSVLTPGQQWQNGKIRICIDFMPEGSTEAVNDSPPSPLDDIRQNSGK